MPPHWVLYHHMPVRRGAPFPSLLVAVRCCDLPGRAAVLAILKDGSSQGGGRQGGGKKELRGHCERQTNLQGLLSLDGGGLGREIEKTNAAEDGPSLWLHPTLPQHCSNHASPQDTAERDGRVGSTAAQCRTIQPWTEQQESLGSVHDRSFHAWRAWRARLEAPRRNARGVKRAAAAQGRTFRKHDRRRARSGVPRPGFWHLRGLDATGMVGNGSSTAAGGGAGWVGWGEGGLKQDRVPGEGARDQPLCVALPW